ncbi:MAG: serine hydrolase domain-containing protein [Sphingobium sp.]
MSKILSVLFWMLVLVAQPALAEALPTPAPVHPGMLRPLDRIDAEAWLDGLVPIALKRGGVAGAVVVIVKDGQVLIQKGYGHGDVARGRPVLPERTLFRMGSLAKPFIWTAIMQLVEQGRLDLDMDINRYLDFRISRRPDGPVTLRHLMTHSAGFEETAKGVVFTDPAYIVPLGARLKAIQPRRIYKAGTTPAYSNYGAALAGYIVERVSGEPFESYVERHIFAPLGMTHATFRQPLPPAWRGDMSQGYDTSDGMPKPFEIIGLPPAGALTATAGDMARFMIAHLQNGALGDRTILRPQTAMAMHGTPMTLLPPLHRMVLGFWENDINGQRVIAHSGDTGAFHTDLNLFLDQNIGVFVAVNSNGVAGGSAALIDAVRTGFADRYFSRQAGGRPIDPGTAALHARMMAGNWISSRRWDSNFMRIVNLFSQLTLDAGHDGSIEAPFKGPNGAPRKWIEIAPFVWRDADSDERLAAKLEAGRPVRFSIDGAAPITVFDRAPWWASAAWLVPGLYGAFCAFAAMLILWPVAALVRRRHGASLDLQPTERRAYLTIRIMAALALLTLVGWGVAISAAVNEHGAQSLPIDIDVILWFMQIASLLVFPAAFAASLWNLRLAWARDHAWPMRLWNVALVMSAAIILWTAFAFRLIGFTTSY